MDDWFAITEIEDGIFIIEERGHVQSYLVNGRDRSALIDTGMGFANIRSAVAPMARADILVLNTHWHFDHIGGNILFDHIGISSRDAPRIGRDISNGLLTDLYIRSCVREGIPLPRDFRQEAYVIRGTKPSFFIEDGDRIDLGGRLLEAIATPGHTGGSLCFMDSLTGSLFCGDFVYEGTLYAHFTDSDTADYMTSLERIAARRDTITRIYTGHNDYKVDADFPAVVLEGFRRIREGGASGVMIQDWGEPALYYEFDRFGILLKSPGSEGIDLFPTTLP
jgi:glyoxylase-like metal-dependent hydrolase (beta-lactamase superfamily II)